MATSVANLFDAARFVSSTGGPEGAVIYFYFEGTTNLAPIFTDKTLTTPMANPVVVATGALLPLVFLDASVKYRRRIVFTSDGSVQDIDPLPMFSGESSPKFNLFDFIPKSLQAGIIAGTSTTDVSGFIQTAINTMDAAGGGLLNVPKGRYYCTSEIVLKKKITIQGEGKESSVFFFTSTNGFRSIWPVNSSTAVFIYLRSIGIKSASPSTNTGIGFWDQCGTFIEVYDVLFRGWKYHIAFDQSELADVDLCNFEYDNATTEYNSACVWLLSSDDLTPGALGGFTNRISISRSQFNGSPFTIGVRIDGGNTHKIIDCNFNGCKNHIYCAGSVPLIVDGGEFEGSSSHSIRLSSTTPGGLGRGQAGLVVLNGCELIVSGSTNYAVQVDSVSYLNVSHCYFGSGNPAGAINGAGNAYSTSSYGNNHSNNYPIFTAFSTQYNRQDALNGFFESSSGYKAGGNKVVGVREAGWTAATGTANKGVYATYDGQTVGAAYVQAEAQATDNAAKEASKRVKALEDALRTHGLIS